MKRFNSDLVQKNLVIQFIIIIFFSILYYFIFILLYNTTGNIIAAIPLIFIIISGWFSGIIGGTVSGFIFFIINFILFSVIKGYSISDNLNNIPYNLSLPLTGAITGLIKELLIKTWKQSEQLKQVNKNLENDVIMRKKAEKALAEDKEYLSAVLKNIGEGVIFADTGIRIALMNEAAENLTGWNRNGAYGMLLSEVFKIKDKILNGVEPIEFPNQAQLISKNGAEISIILSGAAVYDKEKNILGTVLVFRDITEKKIIEDKLAKAQKQESIGILAGGIAHDFNNLLTGIFGFIELAREDLPEDSEAFHLLGDAMKVSNKAKDLTRRLLTFSKGGLPVKKTVSIKEMIKYKYRYVLADDNIKCNYEIPDNLWLCDIDEDQVRQAIDNIIINARQALPEDGIVTLKAENIIIGRDSELPLENGLYVKISIIDHGIGIPPEIQNYIFDPFFTTKPEGNGLGLTAAFSIIQKHSGFLDMQSEKGKGTVFNIYLPVAHNEGIIKEVTSDGSDQKNKQPGYRKILVMDDEKYILDLTSKLLNKSGYSVEVALNGLEAYDKYKKAFESNNPFDLVILDLTMSSGPGGKETLVMLAGIDPGVKAVASSGYSEDPVMAEPHANGFIGTLPKPYTYPDLHKILQKYSK